MQDIIHGLIEIDEGARKLTDEAQKKRREVGWIIAERVAILREHYKKEADERCEAFKQSHMKTAERTIAVLRDKNSAAIKRLENTRAASGEKWTEAVFLAVIGKE